MPADRIHAVDQVFATYRLHPESISMQAGERAFEEVVRISRLYWGAAWKPRHIALSAALAVHRLDRLGRARAVVRRALVRRAQGRRLRALALAGAAGLCAPDLLVRLAIERRQGSSLPRRREEPKIAGDPRYAGVFFERTEPWLDGWVGPRLRRDLAVAGGERHLRLEGTASRVYLGAPLELLVRVDGRLAGKARVEAEGPFEVELPLPAAVAPGHCRVEIDAAPCFVPDTILGNSDRRRLCWLIRSVRLIP